MSTHADKSSENKRQSAPNNPSKFRRVTSSDNAFVDNRPEAITQTKTQAMIDNSRQVKDTLCFVDNRPSTVAQTKLREIDKPGTTRRVSPPIIQKMGVDEINKRHLWKKLRLEGNIRDFEKVNMHTFTGAQYKDEDIEVEGITFPYESPPFVGLDLSNIANNDILAATIYHEVTHAYDPETPSKGDNSKKAKRQDMTNEVTTWKKEIEYSIRTGGEDLNVLIEEGFVVRSKEGMLIPNPKKFTPDALREMGYDEYDTEDRSERFNINNYTFTDNRVLHPFGTPEEKHQYELEIQKEQLRKSHGELEEPMSDDVKGMYG